MSGRFRPDNEELGEKRPVKSRVCGLPTCMVRQEYDKITYLKGLKQTILN